MTMIFISGSREISYVPEEVRIRIDRIVDSGFDIVVGDSERGVDAVVLRYLYEKSYERVAVYTIHDRPRVRNIRDAWEVHVIEPSAAVKTGKAGKVRNRRELETEKDCAMGAIADYGLVVWQSTYVNRFGNTSVSKGSLRNAYQLLSAGKPVVLYEVSSSEDVDETFRYHNLKSLQELDELVKLEPEIVVRAYEKITRDSMGSEPTLFDAQNAM